MGVLMGLRRITTGLGVVFFAAAAFWPRTRTVVRATPKPLVIVVSSALPVTEITKAALYRVFTAHPTDLGGKRLVPINHPVDTPLRVAFDRQLLGLTPSDVGPFWIGKRIRDEGVPPKTVPTAELAVRVAGSLLGAITYALPEQLSPAVKALTIDGKSADSAGYPLHL